jgi:hypothetical protein
VHADLERQLGAAPEREAGEQADGESERRLRFHVHARQDVLEKAVAFATGNHEANRLHVALETQVQLVGRSVDKPCDAEPLHRQPRPAGRADQDVLLRLRRLFSNRDGCVERTREVQHTFGRERRADDDANPTDVGSGLEDELAAIADVELEGRGADDVGEQGDALRLRALRFDG